MNCRFKFYIVPLTLELYLHATIRLIWPTGYMLCLTMFIGNSLEPMTSTVSLTGSSGETKAHMHKRIADSNSPWGLNEHDPLWGRAPAGRWCDLFMTPAHLCLRPGEGPLPHVSSSRPLLATGILVPIYYCGPLVSFICYMPIFP